MVEEIGFKRLLIWKKADELAYALYEITNSYPKSEIYALTSQLRRAGLSVPTNIVEGYARNGNVEFKRFIVIALGSLAEVKYLLDFSRRLKYITSIKYNEVNNLAEETNRILWKFYKSI